MLSGEKVLPGPLMKLTLGTEVAMTDGYGPYQEHLGAIEQATGRVLVHGLGLGCYLRAILNKPDVERVDVVEASGDVLELVGVHFADNSRVWFYHADATTYEWPEEERWDCVWHDIWLQRNPLFLPEYEALLARFRDRCDWQGAWAYEDIQSFTPYA